MNDPANRHPVAPLMTGDPDAPFFDAWNEDQRFLLYRCGICGRHDWPATSCIDHGMSAMEWVDTPGAGVVDTYTVFHRAYTKDMADKVPYTVAVVRLDEGPYFHTQLADIAPGDVTTGLRVRVRIGTDDSFPRFIPE